MLQYLCISCNQEYHSDSSIDCPHCGAGHLFQCRNDSIYSPESITRTVTDSDGSNSCQVEFTPVSTYGSAPGRTPDSSYHSEKRFVSNPYPNFKRSSEHTNLVNDLNLPVRYSRSYINTRSGWRQDLYQATFRHGDFAPYMVRSFTSICEQKDFYTAMQLVQSADERLRRNGVRYTRNDDEIKELAKAKSKAFFRILKPIECSIKRFEKAQFLIGQLGLSFRADVLKKLSDAKEVIASDDEDAQEILAVYILALDSYSNRAMDEVWLRRQLRRVYFVEVESVARDLMLVHKSQDAYCSDYSLDVIKQRQSDTEQSLINTVCYLEDDADTWFTLQELASKSISNPLIRRAEMFVRLKAFEEIAQESGHAAVFYTVTCPSRFHVFSGGEVNPKWEKAGKPGTNEAHKYLMGVSDAFRKKLDKAEIKIYGLRIVEPHHDGTPHHHYLYFMRPEDESRVTQLLRAAALSDSPNESGAAKYRFKSEAIDWKKGSAVGYVAKYISKSVDGANIDSDKATDVYGESGTKRTGRDASARVVSFARLNGIRQFQFIGGPSITTWREMRRFREEFKEDDAMILGNEFSKEEHFVLENIRKAADEGDFKTFVQCMGGVLVKRDDQVVRPAYAKKIDVSGLIKTTRYGDEVSAAIEGILFRGKTIKTRFKEWRFASKKQFIRGIRQMMGCTKLVFETLEEEGEYWAMKFEEFERMQEEYAFYMDMPSVDPTFYFDGDFHEVEPPPDWVDLQAQPVGLLS